MRKSCFHSVADMPVLSVQLEVTLPRPEWVATRAWIAFQAKAKVTGGGRKVTNGVGKVSDGVRKMSDGVVKGSDGVWRCQMIWGRCQMVLGRS